MSARRYLREATRAEIGGDLETVSACISTPFPLNGLDALSRTERV